MSIISNPSSSIREIGNYIKHSKLEYTWNFTYNRPITITLLDSRITGKRRVLLNDRQVYYQRTYGLFTYTFIYMDIKFTIVEHAEENFELYVDHEPFSKYVEVPSDRISDQPSINSRKDIYLEFVSNDENGSFIHIDKQPRRSKSDKVNKISYEDKALKKTYSDSEVAKGVKGDVK